MGISLCNIRIEKHFRKSTYTNRQKMKQFCSRSFSHYLSPFFKKYCFSPTLWLRYVANHFMNCIFPFYDILSLVLCVFVVSCACAWMYVTSFVDDVLQKHLIHVSLQKKTRVVCALCLLKVYLASLRFSGFATCCGVTLNSALSENSHFFSKPSIAPPTLATVW